MRQKIDGGLCRIPILVRDPLLIGQGLGELIDQLVNGVGFVQFRRGDLVKGVETGAEPLAAKSLDKLVIQEAYTQVEPDSVGNLLHAFADAAVSLETIDIRQRAVLIRQETA
jgi:hypothetical protein